MAERSQNSWYRDQDRKIQRIGARTSSQFLLVDSSRSESAEGRLSVASIYGIYIV